MISLLVEESRIQGILIGKHPAEPMMEEPLVCSLRSKAILRGQLYTTG
jgi:hypothetical protein